MNTNPTKAERAHMGKVKNLDCSVCNAPPPSDAHHIDQKCAFTTVALCRSCHNSLHGSKAIWRVMKLDELQALNITLKRLLS